MVVCGLTTITIHPTYSTPTSSQPHPLLSLLFCLCSSFSRSHSDSTRMSSYYQEPHGATQLAGPSSSLTVSEATSGDEDEAPPTT